MRREEEMGLWGAHRGKKPIDTCVGHNNVGFE